MQFGNLHTAVSFKISINFWMVGISQESLLKFIKCTGNFLVINIVQEPILQFSGLYFFSLKLASYSPILICWNSLCYIFIKRLEKDKFLCFFLLVEITFSTKGLLWLKNDLVYVQKLLLSLILHEFIFM